jgi:hypothetical protein
MKCTSQRRFLQAALQKPSYILQLILTDCGHDKEIIDDLLSFAARYSTQENLERLLFGGCDMDSDFEYITDNLRITEDIWRGAAESREGIRRLEWLLKEYQDHIVITPELIAAAAGNAGTGDKMVRLLLADFSDEVRSAHGDQALLAAACSGQTIFRDDF